MAAQWNHQEDFRNHWPLGSQPHRVESGVWAGHEDFYKVLGSSIGKFESNHQAQLAPPTTMTCHSALHWIPCSHTGLSLTILNTHTRMGAHGRAHQGCMAHFLQNRPPTPYSNPITSVKPFLITPSNRAVSLLTLAYFSPLHYQYLKHSYF